MKELGKSLAIGVAAGVFGGLLGLGGGVVMIPLLGRFAALRQHQAHGTSLVALVFTGLGGAAAYASRGAVDVPAALLLAGPAMAAAPVGARFAHALPEWRLKRAFGGFLAAVALLLLLKPYLPGPSGEAGGWTKVGVLLTAGGGTGFVSGMMGVGGGSMMVPAMVLLTGLPQLVAQGSSLLAMVPAGAVGARAHWQLGNVVRRLLPGLVPGILLGTFLGSTLALRLEEGLLRLAFAAVLAGTGLRYLRAPRAEPAAAG